MTTLLATVFVLGILVFVHELGHFLLAKLFKIRVERFSIGYPPRLFGKTWRGTDYCVSLIPFGGYVKISGMVDESLDKSQLESPPQHWEYRSKPWAQRFAVVAAGSVMNLLLAYGIFFASAWMHGTVRVKGTVVGEVVEGKPAALAGLRKGDRIVSLNGRGVSEWEAMTDTVHAYPERPLVVGWTRRDTLYSASITPARDKIVERGDLREVGLIGIWPGEYENVEVGPFRAMGLAARESYYLGKLVVLSLARLVTGRESVKSLAGPVFIAKMAGESAKSGFDALLGFMALLSMNLGLLNLLPFPVLDGGHILLLCIEGVLRRELPLKFKIAVQQAGMVLLIGLMLVAVYNDILRIFKH